MLKVTEQNDKLKSAITLSIALHCVLIAVLIWSSTHQPQETSTSGGGLSIDAVMVDSREVVQQYNSQQQQTDAQRAQQQRLKALEKQRLVVQEAAEAKKTAVTEAKKQDTTESEQKAAAQEKAAAQAVKQSSEVEDLLGGLTDAKNMPKAGGALAGAGNSNQRGASGAEINVYKAQVSRAISNKFYNAFSHSGKTCDLRIKLAPDGLLISVTAVGGDTALCQAAVSAAKLATIPRPPSPQVYEVFKNTTLGFSPQ